MNKPAIIVFLLLLTLFSGFNSKEFNYLPASIDNHQIVAYTQFTLSYNEQHEQADWVAYELTKDEVAMKQKRCNCFKSDKSITTASASKSDYSSTGFDLGHLSPAADNNMNKKANAESFLMSNISPQIPQFNRGIWKYLESWVREQAIIHNSVYIVTGPIFINNFGSIGSNNVTIPGYYYKVLLIQNDSKTKSIAFLMPQLCTSNNLKDYLVTVNTLETITGLDFFPELDKSVENIIESQSQPAFWGL
ncbi:MAG: DNA/RNA non-specific endonuclease [Bacteroidota bacterium]